MPATEQTWRDPKLMHRIFMVSGVALLISTVWMFYADHNREWKAYQDNAREIDQTYNRWMQLQFETDDQMRKHEAVALKWDLARSRPVDQRLLEAFHAELERHAQDTSKSPPSFDHVKKLNDELGVMSATISPDNSAEAVKNRSAAIKIHERVVTYLRSYVANARFDEVLQLDLRKKRNALLDKAKADLDIGVRDNVSSERMKELKNKVDDLTSDVARLTLNYQKAGDHRKELDNYSKQMTAEEDADKKQVDQVSSDLRNLQTAYEQKKMTYINWVGGFIPMPGKKVLTLPILDAFNSPRKIDNLWSDGLTIDYNFQKVRRFDRCTTCHQGLEKSQPGAADQPAYVKQSNLTLLLTTPTKDELTAILAEVQKRHEEEVKEGKASGAEPDVNKKLLAIYGLQLSKQGVVNADDVAINLVLAQSRAAKAKFQESSVAAAKVSGEELRLDLIESHDEAEPEAFTVRPGLVLGDVLASINGAMIQGRQQAERILLTSVDWGKPLRVDVRRGVPDPYTSHPRLDLFVGATSPHKLQIFACSICHEGQGSATAFKWASHTPSSSRQQQDWSRDHGWFDNHHWIFPMYPRRFAESACLKCHHDVIELEPSERFPEPPAPKVVHGYNLIRKYGCYGCHEINGFDGPAKRVGPDLRLEPNFYAAALQIKYSDDGAKLTDQERMWLDDFIDHPERDDLRRRLYEVLNDQKSTERQFTADTIKISQVLKDVEAPGKLRKPGPSLRFAGNKMDDDFLFDWISNPKHFRPNTRMPQFFGLWDHLKDSPDSDIARQYEPVEVLGIVTYLRQHSQPFQYSEPPKGITPSSDDEQLERGKIAFEERGCLACHTHKDFPNVSKYRKPTDIVQGPDLSAVGTKLGADRHRNGRRWLYSWIRQPTRYHTRTVMPDLFLDPIETRDEQGEVISVTDPIADIVAYLMSSVSDWRPAGSIPSVSDAPTMHLVDELVRTNLEESFSKFTAERYLQNGIPQSLAKELKGAEKELLTTGSGNLSDEQKLLYLGRKAIGKYGCYGCHDIAGFEDAKPIGTALADWGRKDPAKLAFEHITHYVHGQSHHGGEHGNGGHAQDDHGSSTPTLSQVDEATVRRQQTTQYFLDQLNSGNRIGFIWQKLREPRSYDYLKTENKRYNERLRMPQFPFDEDDREAVITFVIGLVADPPHTKFVYHPDERGKAIIEGRQVLDKYNCGGCHLLATQTWSLAHEAEALPVPEFQGFPFMATHFSPEKVATSEKSDSHGLVHSRISGMPTLADEDATPIVEDNEGDRVDAESMYDPAKIAYRLDPWAPAAVAGKSYEVGLMPIGLTPGQVERMHDSRGGVLARSISRGRCMREKQVNPGAKGSEAWGWVPPPLTNEGQKLQTAWLHDFLLNPYPIRPSVVLRMPRFNMSSEEATSLVKYFCAMDNAEYPYAYNERRQSAYLQREEQEYQSTLADARVDGESTRLDDAMRIITNSNYCVKCHLVSEFEPKGRDRAKAPNLARVYERIRPDFMRRWIANPKQVLPYTSMPQNLPYLPDSPTLGGIDQNLYHGTSIEQLDAIVDLLMNFDNYAKGKSPISPLVQQNVTPAPPDASSGANP